MKRTCTKSGIPFEIEDADLLFYERLGVPAPTLWPEERMRRRLAYRNERSLYHRVCSGTGEKIISMYSPDKPFPVYENEHWWSDHWDAMEQGREIDFTKPFFEQFFSLLNAVPKMARIQQGEMINSKYCNCVAYQKNSYLLFSSTSDEDCLYGTWVNNCKSCMDNFHALDSELLFECVNCENCYGSRFLTNCKNCSDSWFLESSIGCQHCYSSVNLRNKRYYFRNEKCTPEEYHEKVESARLDTRKGIQKALSEFKRFRERFPRRFYEGVRNENVSGNYINNSKNANQCFDVNNVEDCRYCDNLANAKSCYDVSYYGGRGTNELLYECEGVGHGVFDVMFSKLVWGSSSNVLYSYECLSSINIFGCAGVKKKENCILNTQYSESDYKKLSSKLIDHMKDTGEWGEFFPIEHCPFGYNESVAAEYFPLSKEVVMANGWKWMDEEESADIAASSYKLPESISEVKDDVLSGVICCRETAKPYRIAKAELDFCRKNKLPLQDLSPQQRHLMRLARRRPRTLWPKKCDNCSKLLETVFAPDCDDIVYCEECYLESVE